MTFVLLVMCILPLTACGGGPKIDGVPKDVQEAYVGAYKIPTFEVVNAADEVLSWYTVGVSVKGPGGAAVTVLRGRQIEVETPGVYTITLSAKGVKRASYKVNFTHAPSTVNIMSSLPKAYVMGAWYQVPRFRFEGDADLQKCAINLYHVSVGGVRRDVPLTSGGFTADYGTGEYMYVVTAVSFNGIEKDYEFTVPAAKGPDNVIAGKILYLDEEFGLSQISAGVNQTLSYSTDYAYSGEAGSLKVEYGEFNPNSSHFTMLSLIESDVSDYTYLVYRVFNPNAFTIYAGYLWFGDTACPAGQWTEVRWKISDGFPNSGVSSGNIVGLQTRLFLFSGDAVKMNGATLYLSAMYAE